MEEAKGAGIGGAIGVGISLMKTGFVSLMGFKSAGVAAGSMAAGVQAGIGNVAAGSTFALFQSIGATGALISPPLVICGIAFGGCYYWWKK